MESGGSSRVMAYWSTDSDGLDWLEPMMAQGKASMQDGSRYPLLFQMPAGELLPLLTPSGVQRIDRRLEVAIDTSSFFNRHKVTICTDVIDSCPQDAVLTVEAWDRAYPTPSVSAR